MGRQTAGRLTQIQLTARILLSLGGPATRPWTGSQPTPPEADCGPARKTIATDVAMYDFNLLRNEIVRNLRNDGGDVTVEVIIRADKTDGFSESITRAVRENSVQLELDFSETDYGPEQ